MSDNMSVTDFLIGGFLKRKLAQLATQIYLSLKAADCFGKIREITSLPNTHAMKVSNLR
jgi:hypothetical protein